MLLTNEKIPNELKGAGDKARRVPGINNYPIPRNRFFTRLKKLMDRNGKSIAFAFILYDKHRIHKLGQKLVNERVTAELKRQAKAKGIDIDDHEQLRGFARRARRKLRRRSHIYRGDPEVARYGIILLNLLARISNKIPKGQEYSLVIDKRWTEARDDKKKHRFNTARNQRRQLNSMVKGWFKQKFKRRLEIRHEDSKKDRCLQIVDVIGDFCFRYRHSGFEIRPEMAARSHEHLAKIVENPYLGSEWVRDYKKIEQATYWFQLPKRVWRKALYRAKK